MKSAQRQAFFQDLKDRGYEDYGDVWATKEQASRLGLEKPEPKKKSRAKYFRSGDMDDELNIKHKAEIRDMFTMLMDKLDIPCWPEFLFLADRKYAFDYAWPEHKICLEVEGGIWSKGNSGHSSGTGIQRDMDKISMAASLGWRTLRVVPSDLLTQKTVDLIKKCIENK